MADQNLLLNDEIASLITSWQRAMRARNLAPRTIDSYLETANQFAQFIREQVEGPAELEHLTKAMVETYINWVLDNWKASTASVRYKSLQQFFKWLVVDEEELETSPMATMKPPIIPEELVPILTDDQMAALFKTCNGPDFMQRRDMAILRLFADTGMRAEAMEKIELAKLDLNANTVVSIHKGRKEKVFHFGPRTAAALDRYLRVRAKHKRAADPLLWLGNNNRKAMTYNGIHQMVQRRGLQIGVQGLHPHQFRHTFGHNWLANGGNEGDLMVLGDWRSRQMLDRYGKSGANVRAKEAHARLGLGERY